MATNMAARHWRCLEPLSCTQLAGYDDTNLKLTGPGGDCMLKVHNESDSQEGEQFAEAQNALLRHLAAAGFPVPAPLPVLEPSGDGNTDAGGGWSGSGATSDGFTLRVTAGDGRLHAVRMLTWMPGTLLVEVQQSAELYRQLGSLLARVNTALQGWEWRATGVMQRQHAWNLMHLAATFRGLRPDLLQLPGLDVPLLDQVVALFQAATSAAGSGLRCGIIHSDANERNVLIDAPAAAVAAAAERQAARHVPADGKHAGGGDEHAQMAGSTEATAEGAAGAASAGGGGGLITGLIDWGDACWQWLAAEPAIAMLYMMLLDCNAADPLPAGAALLAGYERQLALLPAERQLLRTLVMGRLAQSLSLGAHAAVQQPDNTAYLLGTQKNGWSLLRLLWGMSDRQFLDAMRSASP